MPRNLRIQFPGMSVHVTTRGNRKGDIFIDNQDRVAFDAILANVCDGCGWESFSYCQMGNHYHNGLYIPKGNLSIGMQKLNGDYAKYFNERHGLVGRVYQRRYFSWVVNSDRYFLELCRYIALNPVKDNFVSNQADWPWGSYRAVIGLEPAPFFLNRFRVLSYFGDDEATAIQNYVEFIGRGRRQLAINYPQLWCQEPKLGIRKTEHGARLF